MIPTSNQGIKEISVNAELHDDRRDFDIEIDQSRADVINRVYELANEVGVKLRHWSNCGHGDFIVKT